MKISRIKDIVVTSIIFLVIIAVIVFAYNASLEAIKNSTEKSVYRVVATKDINPGELITEANVKVSKMPDVVKADGLIYRLGKADARIEDVGASEPKKDNDDLWAIGKIAVDKIYEGEVLLAKNLTANVQNQGEKTRLYAVPFDSATTGGYNIGLGKKVDICVLYDDNDKTISKYQTLSDNKAIDIVLSEKIISDIRDQSGNSAANNTSVVPGYVCFNLTYEEINKLEIAKRQGTLFIGSTNGYYESGSQGETFMQGSEMPVFNSGKDGE